MEPFDTRDLALLTVNASTRWIRDRDGRLVRETDPDESPAPRFCILGSSSGNLAFVRNDVSGIVSRKLLGSARSEPPMGTAESVPANVGIYRFELNREGSVEKETSAVLFKFPAKHSPEYAGEIVSSGTAAGDAFTDRIRTHRMPQGLVELGFRSVDDFWEPWSVAFQDERVASIAFTARTGPDGAECGVVTLPAQRGRGHAVRAVAAWSEHPDLAGKTLFYSALNENTASRRVAEKLGLTIIGSSYSIF